MHVRNRFPSQITSLPRGAGRAGMEAFRLAAERCDVLFVTASAGATIPIHDHDTNNIAFALSGEMVVTTDGREHRYGPGECYEMAAGETHAVRFDVDTVLIELRFERGQVPAPEEK